jgi:hypothetical protein
MSQHFTRILLRALSHVESTQASIDAYPWNINPLGIKARVWELLDSQHSERFTALD